MSAAGFVRFGGIPTDVDVRALHDTFGVPTEGQRIPYEDIAGVIGVEPRSNRWMTVVTAWRKRLIREHNVYLLARDGALIGMAPEQRVDLGSGKLRTGVRMFRRAHDVVSGTDRTRLSSEQKAQADHVQMVSASVIQSARLSARKVTPKLPEGVKSENKPN